MVNRVGHHARDVPAFLPEERVSLAESVAAFTSGTAYINHDDQEAGRLAPGMRADLAVVDSNFFAEGADPVADASVEMTFASGVNVYERP